MSYRVLARKWRPRSFAELAGQEHVVKALVHALDSGRLHHAFLFSGTRGVGKTTIARLVAKSLNCETGVSSRPCGKCAACVEIDEGRFVDLIEVDAASRTKVDDTRELLDNVQYAPTSGAYKVYLIDEVHMLSNHSFNALLKTLEEPPPHVKFLLATTEPQKLPVTVLSRCLQFNLKRLPQALIVERLRHILVAEAIEFEPAALTLIARAAEGSMRDALSLADQVIAFGAGRVAEEPTREMLGTVDRGHIVRLLERLAAGDARGLLEEVATLAERAPDFAQALGELASLVQKVALTQAIADGPEDELYAVETLQRLAAAIGAEDLQLYYQIALNGRRDLDFAPDARSGFEMTLLRMLAFRPALDDGTSSKGREAPVPSVPRTTVPRAAPSPSPAVSAVSAPTAPFGSAEAWAAVVTQLDQGAARQLAGNCAWAGFDDGTVRLRLDARSQQLRTRQIEEKLAQALSRLAGRDIRLSIEVAEASVETPARQQARVSDERLDAARAALEEDPLVRAVKERLGGVVVAESVKPVN
ncbi:MAG TPA: DNA polymerase III subunit gamma/tau [Steroidobacteraceae bacterium]|nr:DNA polymerase III subunit gamma/tau [Steroidobacteraceae bacterium]